MYWCILKALFASADYFLKWVFLQCAISACRICPSYEHFTPTPCFVHRVDVKPMYLEKYRSTEPLLCWAGAQAPWHNKQLVHLRTLPMDSGKRGERVDQGQRCPPRKFGHYTQQKPKKMGAAGQIFGQNLDGFYQQRPKKGSSYNGPPLFPSLKNFNFILFHIWLKKTLFICSINSKTK